MKQSTTSTCPSDISVVKLLTSSNDSDIELGLNFLGRKSFNNTKQFIIKYKLNEIRSRECNQRFLVNAGEYFIVSGWYFIEAMKDPGYYEKNENFKLVTI